MTEVPKKALLDRFMARNITESENNEKAGMKPSVPFHDDDFETRYLRENKMEDPAAAIYKEMQDAAKHSQFIKTMEAKGVPVELINKYKNVLAIPLVQPSQPAVQNGKIEDAVLLKLIDSAENEKDMQLKIIKQASIDKYILSHATEGVKSGLEMAASMRMPQMSGYPTTASPPQVPPQGGPAWLNEYRALRQLDQEFGSNRGGAEDRKSPMKELTVPHSQSSSRDCT
jgi:hypothetical protein